MNGALTELSLLVRCCGEVRRWGFVPATKTVIIWLILHRIPSVFLSRVAKTLHKIEVANSCFFACSFHCSAIFRSLPFFGSNSHRARVQWSNIICMVCMYDFPAISSAYCDVVNKPSLQNSYGMKIWFVDIVKCFAVHSLNLFASNAYLLVSWATTLIHILFDVQSNFVKKKFRWGKFKLVPSHPCEWDLVVIISGAEIKIEWKAHVTPSNGD